MSLRLSALVGTHHIRHLAIFVAQLWPTVNPTDRRQRQHTPYATTILEHDTIPVAFLSINDRSLCQIGETTEITLQNGILLPRTLQVLCAVTHLAAMTPRGKHMADEQGIICTIMLDDARTLKETALVGFTLEIMAVTAFYDTLQIACQLTHLACTEEDVGRTIVIEEQGSIVEMTQTRVDSPGTFSLISSKDIGIAHSAGLVGSQQRPELAIMIFQRGSPLSTSVDSTLLEIVLGGIRQFVKHVTYCLPI